MTLFRWQRPDFLFGLLPQGGSVAQATKPVFASRRGGFLAVSFVCPRFRHYGVSSKARAGWGKHGSRDFLPDTRHGSSKFL